MKSVNHFVCWVGRFVAESIVKQAEITYITFMQTKKTT